MANAAGIVQERYAYTPFGMPTFLTAVFGSRGTSAVAWDILYSGYRWDGGTGLFCVRNRVLTPLLGTWLQRDPLGVILQDANLFQYVANSPTTFSDPSGETVWGGIGGGFGGGLYGGASGAAAGLLALAAYIAILWLLYALGIVAFAPIGLFGAMVFTCVMIGLFIGLIIGVVAGTYVGSDYPTFGAGFIGALTNPWVLILPPLAAFIVVFAILLYRHPGMMSPKEVARRLREMFRQFQIRPDFEGGGMKCRG